MAHVIEVVIQGRDNTASAVASARANIAGLTTIGQDRSRFASVGAGSRQAAAAQAEARALQVLEQATLRASLAGQTAAQRVATLTARYNEQARQVRQTGLSTLELTNRKIALARTEDQLTRATRAYTRESDRAFASQQRSARSGMSGPALPRTFAGFTGQGALQGLGALGVATAGPELIGQLKQLADQGQVVQASLDGTRASLGALLQDQDRANRIIATANRFGDQYKMTQQSIAQALQASSQIIRTSTSSTEELLSVLGRLQVVSPEQSLDEAALALKELASGDIQSLRERFEISGDAARQMKREIEGGADAVQVLGRYLDSIGVTNGVLEAGLSGAAGEQRAWNKAIEDLQLRVNGIVSSAGWRSFAAGLIQDTAQEVGYLQDIGVAINNIGKQVAQNPAIRWLDEMEDRLSNAIQRYQREKQIAQEGVLGITQARRLAAAEAKTSREDAYIAPSTSIGPTAMTLPPQAAGFAGFSPRGTNVYVTVQGNVTTQEDLTDAVHRGLQAKAQQNGYQSGVIR